MLDSRKEKEQDVKSSESHGSNNLALNETSKENAPVKACHNQKNYWNFGRVSLIFLHLLTPACYVIVFGSACALSHSDAKNTTDRCADEYENSTCNVYYRGYFYSVIPFYAFGMVGTLPMLYYTIQTYLDHAYKHAYLRLGIQQQDMHKRTTAIRSFTRLIDHSFFQITSENGKKLSRANFFSAAFIADSFTYGAAYLLYMFIEKKLDSVPRYIIVSFLGVSGLLVLFFMVFMNTQIDKTQNTLRYLDSYQHIRRQLYTNPRGNQTHNNSSTESPDIIHNNNVISLQTIVNYFDAKAKIFGYVPKTLTLLSAIAALAVPKIVLFVLTDHGILKNN